jgi:hypothetical protein
MIAPAPIESHFYSVTTAYCPISSTAAFFSPRDPNRLCHIAPGTVSSKIRIVSQASVCDETCTQQTYSTNNMADRFPSIEDIDAGEPNVSS